MDYGEVFGYRFCIEHIMTYREVALQIVALLTVVSPMAIEIGSQMEQEEALLTGSWWKPAWYVKLCLSSTWQLSYIKSLTI